MNMNVLVKMKASCIFYFSDFCCLTISVIFHQLQSKTSLQCIVPLLRAVTSPSVSTAPLPLAYLEHLSSCSERQRYQAGAITAGNPLSCGSLLFCRFTWKWSLLAFLSLHSSESPPRSGVLRIQVSTIIRKFSLTITTRLLIQPFFFHNYVFSSFFIKLNGTFI